jgi:hypothetical protein
MQEIEKKGKGTQENNKTNGERKLNLHIYPQR